MVALEEGYRIAALSSSFLSSFSLPGHQISSFSLPCTSTTSDFQATGLKAMEPPNHRLKPLNCESK